MLSVIAKIVIARNISTYAMSIYSLTLPTMSLLISISQLGIPTTISKLIAKKKYPTLKIMQVSVILLLLIDLIVGAIYIFLVPTIASSYLKNELTTLTLYGIVLLLPLVSLTSLLKGYFIGINKVEKTSICQISEEIARLLFIIVFVDLIDKNNISLLSFFAMFSSIIGEIASLIHLVLSLNIKNKKITKRIKINNDDNKIINKTILQLSLYSTSTRIIGTIIYFFEPIIYTYLMIKNNISNEQLTLDYGIINSYVFPLLLLPSFFSNCISTFILPKLSYQIESKNYKKVKKIFFYTMFSCLFVGIFAIFAILIFPEFLSKLLYGKEIGITYIKRYALFMIIYFIQMPIHITLISFDKEKMLLFESIICNIIKIVSFFIFIPLFKIDGLVISIFISIYLSILIHIISLKKSFNKLKKESKLLIK